MWYLSETLIISFLRFEVQKTIYTTRQLRIIASKLPPTVCPAFRAFQDWILEHPSFREKSETSSRNSWEQMQNPTVTC